MSIQDVMDKSSISRFQVIVIGVCLVLNMVDGFDVLVMAFAASGVAKEFALDGSHLGVLLSAGLVGMAVGSAVVAPAADRIGRRPLILICLVLSTLGMALAAVSTGFVTLALCRVLAGLGIGGMVASLPVVVAEYSPRRRRGAAIAFYATGLPLGGVVGGLAATLLTTHLGWRATFGAGALLTAVMLLVVYLAMPESADFLLARRPAGTLEKVNMISRKLGHAPVEALPAPLAADSARQAILQGANGVRTALLWTAFFIMMGGYYFAASWTPRLLEQSGFSARQGLNGGVLLNVGGVVAALTFGLLALVVASRLLAILSFMATAVVFVAFGFALGSTTAALIGAVGVGMAISASAAGLFAIAPDLYPASVRSTAVGWATAVGRIGGIITPILVGVLVDRGWGLQALFSVFALPMALAALAVAAIAHPAMPIRLRRGVAPHGADEAVNPA